MPNPRTRVLGVKVTEAKGDAVDRRRGALTVAAYLETLIDKDLGLARRRRSSATSVPVVRFSSEDRQ